MTSDRVLATIETHLPDQPLKPFLPSGNVAPLDALMVLAHFFMIFESPHDGFCQDAATEGTHQVSSGKEDGP